MMRLIKTRRIVLFRALAMLSGFLIAGQTLAAEFPTLYRGIRPLGMGNAFITLSDDENALFSNPAGLNDVTGFGGMGLVQVLGEVSEASIDLYSDIKDVDGSDIVEVTNALSQHIGKHQHIRAASLPHVYFHNFAFAILAQGTMDMEVRNPALPDVVTDVKGDLGAAVGLAYGLLDQMVQVGGSAKVIQRQGVKKTFSALEIAAGSFDPFEDLEKADDISFDAGAKVNLPFPLKPTAAVVLQNITDLDFGVLGKYPEQINAGVAVNPSIIGLVSTSLIAEVVDVTRRVSDEEDRYKRVRLGAEARFPKILTLRGGFNQGYLSAGATLDFWMLRLDVATYAEEVGTYAGQRDDRRYVGQVRIGF